MNDDPSTPPDLIATGLAGLIDGVRRDIDGLRDDFREDNQRLRQDFREDNASLEERMTNAIGVVSTRQAETRELIVDFAKGHAELHEEENVERREAHSAFYKFMRDRELAEARRDGALGVVRFGVELVSKHSTKLVQLLLAVAALLGIVTGAVRVGVGA